MKDNKLAEQILNRKFKELNHYYLEELKLKRQEGNILLIVFKSALNTYREKYGIHHIPFGKFYKHSF